MPTTLNLRKLLITIVPLVLALLVVNPHAGQRLEDSGLICECEGCTSILVGKAASVDGSTMTSHSCDSTTDRTWMNIVPHQTAQAGRDGQGLLSSRSGRRGRTTRTASRRARSRRCRRPTRT